MIIKQVKGSLLGLKVFVKYLYKSKQLFKMLTKIGEFVDTWMDTQILEIADDKKTALYEVSLYPEGFMLRHGKERWRQINHNE